MEPSMPIKLLSRVRGAFVETSAQWISAAQLSVKRGDVDGLCRLLQGNTEVDAGKVTPVEYIDSIILRDTLIGLDPLHTASAAGHRDMVEFLLTEVSSWLVFTCEEEGGSTALHTCARFGRVDIAADLLRHGSLVSSRDGAGCTALHIACEHQDEELVQILLAAGSPVDSRDKNGGTPLFTSVRAGGSPAVLRLLLHKDVDVDAAPDGEPTAFALASGMGCLAAVRLLAGAGADLMSAADNLRGERAVHLAAKNGSSNVLSFLLAAGCSVEARDMDGRTPLASACAGGRRGTAETLLSGDGWGLDYIPQGMPSDVRQNVLSYLVASPNTRDLMGNSALLAACEHRGSPDVLDLLAAHGADFSFINRCGESALHVACRRGNVALATHLLGRKTVSRKTRVLCVEASMHATDARGRRPGQVQDIDVGVHEALAVGEVLRRYSAGND